MKKISISEFLGKGFMHGADYNPDQWGMAEDVLEEDFKLMGETSCTSMSIGIFSWSKFEPKEGVYEFQWMDQLMDRLHANGMKGFLATPSGGKPMWMTEKYPEIRRVDAQGLREPAGFRHNHCPSSSVYREKVAQLNEKLAERYSNHPALGLWHISNELQGECFCENCLTRFQGWLEKKYQSLENLNQAWWSGFWNHTISSWSQIDPRDPSVDGMLMDWKRFVNDLHVEFLENEMAPLRRHNPNIPCSTNFMIADAPLLNYGLWAKHLDVISNDAYPNYFGAGDREEMLRRVARFSFIGDMCRGMNDGKPWMLLECSPSKVNWTPVNKLKPNGMHKVEVAQAIAHGADTIHYFQWRKGRGGFEKFHGAVLDHDVRPDARVFREVVETGDFLKSIAPMAKAPVTGNKTAIFYDWESQWATNTSCGVLQPNRTHLDIAAPDAHDALTYDHYQGAWSAGLGIDVIMVDPHVAPDLSDHRLLMIPTTFLLREHTAKAVLDFVAHGGTVVLTNQTAVVNEHNQVFRGGLPGLGLHQAAGVKVEEIEDLYDDEVVQVVVPTEYRSRLKGHYEIKGNLSHLHLQGAESVVEYGEGTWLKGPAVTRAKHGKGNVWTIGAQFNSEFYRDLYTLIREDNALATVFPGELPAGVAATKRSDDDDEYTILINYNDHPKVIEIPDGCFRETSPCSLELPAYGVQILTALITP